LKLLTTGNPKVNKGEKIGYWSFVLHLAPAKLSGYNVCPMATQGCTMACLNTAGRGGIAQGGILTHEAVANGHRNQIQAARIRRTKLFFEDRKAFMDLLERDIETALAAARVNGFTAVFRLNGTSDIRWETVRDKDGKTIFEQFPTVQFYDYTKIANRKAVPANYHLTFSLADGNDEQAAIALANGISVAAVFRNKEAVQRYMDHGFMGTTVINGDETDLRFLDPKGVVVGLYAKGHARKDQSGFVRD
jgi:hypothetical protein